MSTLNLDGRPPAQPTPAQLRVQVALLASISTVLASAVARYIFGAPFVPEVLSDWVFSVLPISLVEAGVSLLGPFAKQLGLLGCIVVYLIALAASGVGALRLCADKSRPSALTAAVVSSVATLLVVFPALGAGLLGANLRQGLLRSSLWMLAIYTLFGLAVLVIARIYLEPEHGRDRTDLLPASTRGPKATNLIGRRSLARWTFYAIAGVAIYDIARSLLDPLLRRGAGRVRHGSGVFPEIDGLATEITSTPDFYDVSKNAYDPDVDVARWRLQIGGLVQSPLSLSYDEIRQLPSVEQYATLECISNPVGGDLIGNALWRGVPLKDLLERATLTSGVVDIVLRASDGYSDSIPLQRALAGGTMLAYEMNGAPLNQTHGFPLRLIVPGIYGMKNVKWITAIEAVGFDYKGYWQKRGWDDRAEYKTMSRIDVPAALAKGPSTIAGIAFAGDRGISRVQVSTDGGKSWEEAVIKPALSAYTWVLWHKDWTPLQTGQNQVVVRAADGQGTIQTSAHAPPVPDGASGYHSRAIRV